MKRRRWGDNDRHFGPLTFSFRESWRPIAAILSSGSSDEDEGGCHVRLQAFGATLICELPAIVKPHRRWVDTSRYEWSTNPHGGYWDEHRREYGFLISNGHLGLSLGPQTGDSSTTKNWGCFLPWTQWRQVAHRVFNPDGSLNRDVEGLPWPERMEVLRELPRAGFLIEDFDGERITASVYAEEREHRLGTGWFRWLGYLRTMRVRRALDIRFSSELGRDKGSWKGGTLGHGIEMLPGETAEQAMRRYCEKEHRSKSGPFRITFIGPTSAMTVAAHG
jgi:hypothetical protein